MRRDDRGFTLVEIIISIAVWVFVIGAAVYFMQNALSIYGHAAKAIDLQVEAQDTMEQLATWIMEGNYVQTTVNKDVLIVYHIPREATDSANQELMGECWKRVFWCDDSKLYLYESREMDYDEIVDDFRPDVTPGEDYTDSLADDGYVICNYVEGLKVGIQDFDAAAGEDPPNKVSVTLTMKSKMQEYELRNEISMRNAVYKAAAVSPP